MKEFIIVRSLFDQRKRQLLISKDNIIFEDKDLRKDPFTTLLKENIAGIRHGIHFIKGLEFYIGREYLIFIKDHFGKELKINFKLFYGRKLQQKHKLYNDIINELWVNFFDEKITSFHLKINQNIPFVLGSISFEENCLKFENKIIQFNDLGIKEYRHYFVLYSIKDYNINKLLYYLKDDNAVLVLALLNKFVQNSTLN